MCSQGAPCPSLGTALGVGKPLVKITGSIADNVTIDSKDITILASPGARLTGNIPGTIIKVYGSAQVSIFGLEIIGATTKQAPFESGVGIAMQPGNRATLSLDHVVFIKDDEGVHVEAGKVDITRSTFSENDSGVSASSGGILNITDSTFSQNTVGIAASNYTGSLNVTRATISHNLVSGIDFSGGTLTMSQSVISHNTGRGIIVSSGTISFYIVNNFIVSNGAKDSAFSGGITVFAPSSNSKLEFNTIVDNLAANGGGSSSGIDCNGKINVPNNIVFRNTGGVGNTQVSTDCNSGNSLLTAPDNPGFVSDTDYHLTLNSPPTILNVFDCTGIDDYDGDSRPQGGKCDLGADEYKATAP